MPWFTMFESEWIAVPADPCCPRGLGSWRGSVAPACRRSEGAGALLIGKISDISTPPAKKTEPSNLVLRAQDHKKNPKFIGWQ